MSFTARPLSVGSADFSRIQHWRRRYIGANPANEPDFATLERVRDEASHHFAFYKDDKLAGGVRFTPLGHGLTLTEKLIDTRTLFEPRHRFLDVNRLVIDESLRGEGLAVRALRDCFQWVRDNTLHDGLIALCAPHFVPLYSRVGARVVLEGVTAAHAAGKSYSLIHMIFETDYGQQLSAES